MIAITIWGIIPQELALAAITREISATISGDLTSERIVAHAAGTSSNSTIGVTNARLTLA
jgi:hypothetical protein